MDDEIVKVVGFSCFQVPGQNSWTESSSEVVLHPCENWESPPREKRQREDDAAIDGMDTQVIFILLFWGG